MKIAIVILNWNGKDLLNKFLPSILKYSNQDYCSIYVIDNDSSDESITHLKKHFPSVNIIQNSSNLGFAQGYNHGLKQIEATYYALLNSDIEVTQGWLDPIIDHFEKNPNTTIIQPKLIDYNNKDLFEYAGAAGGYIDKFGYAYCRGRIFNSLESDKGQYANNTPIFWASGACFFIRAKSYHELGGFDEQFFAHFEEIDLCWRAQNLNHEIYYIHNSTVYHVGGATLEESNPMKTYLNFRNSLCTLVKNLPQNKIYPIIFTRLLLDGITGIKFLFEFKPKHTFAIIRAHFSFYARLPESLKFRKNIKARKETYFSTKSIVWEYFIKGKKSFNDLD